ncbi:MAG: NAD+ synthase, partial [Bacteroidetes bacterium]
MKIALAQLNYHIGNFDSNVEKIVRSIHHAEEQGADLVVFAELAVSGYPPRDFLEFRDFVERCNNSVKEIARYCTKTAAIVGLPTFNPADKGKPLYNSAAFIVDGKVQQLVHKSLLPNYDIFDEYRYFEPNKQFQVVEFKGKKLALTICEDIWNVQDNPLYTVNPVGELMKFDPDMIINIAASPFNYHQTEIRTEILKRNAQKYNLPLFYVNHVGAQTELIFDGGSLVMNKKGQVVDELNYFEEDLKIYDIDEICHTPPREPDRRSDISMIHDALVLGIRNYFQKLGFQKAIIGLSGGIDSALTAAL